MENGQKNRVKNQTLWDAFNALKKLGEQKLPAVSVGFKLAVNLNHLRPLILSIEQARDALIREHNMNDPAGPAEAPIRLEKFNKAIQELWGLEVEWSPPITLSSRAFEQFAVESNCLAALLDAGIIISE